MFRFIYKNLVLLAILLPLISVSVLKVPYAYAEDVVEEEEATIEETTPTEPADADGEAEEPTSKGSPHADTTLLMTKPSGDGSELPGGRPVELLVGFTNNGNQDFVLDKIDASFRYHMDFSFFIQNFSAIPLNKVVKPKHEATVLYSFLPSEAFAGRPLGLTVLLKYHNDDGYQYEDAVFNQTVSIVDIDEGLDGETFFLYVFLFAFAVLLLLAGHHFLKSYGRRKGEGKKKSADSAATKTKGIDYEWIPKELLPKEKRAGGTSSPKQSPRQRKSYHK